MIYTSNSNSSSPIRRRRFFSTPAQTDDHIKHSNTAEKFFVSKSEENELTVKQEEVCEGLEISSDGILDYTPAEEETAEDLDLADKMTIDVQRRPNSDDFEINDIKEHEYGYILVKVYALQDKTPISDAAVIITTADTDSTIVSFDKTDESGSTRPVKLMMPMRNSLSDTECSKYNITIKHPDFADVILKDVDVFCNEITLKQVDMIRLL